MILANSCCCLKYSSGDVRNTPPSHQAVIAWLSLSQWAIRGRPRLCDDQVLEILCGRCALGSQILLDRQKAPPEARQMTHRNRNLYVLWVMDKCCNMLIGGNYRANLMILISGPDEGGPPRKKVKSPPVISPTGSSTSLYSGGSSSIDWSKSLKQFQLFFRCWAPTLLGLSIHFPVRN